MPERVTLLSTVEKLEKGCKAELCSDAFKREWVANHLNGIRYFAIMSGRDYSVRIDSEREVHVFVRTTDRRQRTRANGKAL